MRFSDSNQFFAPFFVSFRFVWIPSVYPPAADARRLIKGGGARIDGEKIQDEGMALTAETFAGADQGKEGAAEVRLSAGKKRHGIVQLSAAASSATE